MPPPFFPIPEGWQPEGRRGRVQPGGLNILFCGPSGIPVGFWIARLGLQRPDASAKPLSRTSSIVRLPRIAAAYRILDPSKNYFENFVENYFDSPRLSRELCRELLRRPLLAGGTITLGKLSRFRAILFVS